MIYIQITIPLTAENEAEVKRKLTGFSPDQIVICFDEKHKKLQKLRLDDIFKEYGNTIQKNRETEANG